MFVVALICVALTGCIKAVGADKAQRSAQTSAERITIAIMHPTYDQKLERSSVWTYIEDKFNIQYQPTTSSVDSYNTKLMIAASLGKMPDVVLWTSYKSELVRFVRSGLFHDLTPYIEQSEHLRNIPQEILENAKIDGKLYGIPRPRALVAQAVMIRKDWLDALKLPLPVTTDDYFKTAAMFGQEDPDHNGQHDTFGFGAGEALNFLNDIYLAFGAGNTWLLQEDGTLIASKASPGREQGLKWLRALYQERGIDQGFSVLKPTQVWERFTEGRTGILIAPISDFHHLYSKLKEHQPEAELVMLGPPVGPDGHSGFPESDGYYGRFMIPSSVPLEKVQIIVDLLDWESSEEGYHIRQYGLPGVHHTVKQDGTLTVDLQKLEADALTTLLLMNPYDPYLYVSPIAPLDIQQQQREALDLVRGIGVADPTAGYMSDTGLAVGSLYTQTIRQYETDYIMGNLPENIIAEYREEWLDKGGAQATREINEWYSAAVSSAAFESQKER